MAGGERNHGRDSPYDSCSRESRPRSVGRPLRDPVAFPGPPLHWTAPNPSFAFWLLGVVSATSAISEGVPLCWPSLGVFSWRHGGVGRTWTFSNATFCFGITLRKPGGLSAPREDPKRRPNQRETHHKKGKRKRETLKMAEQKRDCGSVPAQTAPYTARCPVVRSDAERTLLRMFAFLGHCRCNFSP